MCQRWITEYENHLLSGNQEEAEKIKNKYANRSFYKYRCFDNNKPPHWEDWVKGTLYANSPMSFNDPFDCMLTTSSKVYDKIFTDISNELLNVKSGKLDKSRSEEHREEFGERIRLHFKKIIIATCFSQKNDSILMWSHYANHHQGFCIEYNFGNDHEISKRLYPVIYSKKRTILQDCTKNNTFSILATTYKAPEWEYEQEWRYLAARKSGGIAPIKLHAPNTVKSIYLGVESQKNVALLKHIARELNIQLYQMRFDDNEYKLIPHMI